MKIDWLIVKLKHLNKETPMLKKRFSESMYESSIIVIISKSEEMDRAYDIKERQNWFYAENWVLRLREWVIKLKYLSHEIMHFTVQQLREIREIKLNPETEEIYAYFYSYYLDKIWNRIQMQHLKEIEKK